MSPPKNDCAGGLDRHGEADYGTTEQREHSTTAHTGLVHISVALRRARNRLAKIIATPDEVFSSDMSLVIDRQQVEIERLRKQLAEVE